MERHGALIVDSGALSRFRDQTVLVVTPHSDDPALFCGGTVRLLANAGARVVYLRVTQDETDSVGLSKEETIRRTTEELAAAAQILGINDIVEFGYPTDRMSDVPETELRERLIREVRRCRPYAVLTFDPYSAFGEDNQDHIRVAQAMDETFWTAMFDKHHPEHALEGLEPHGVVERWYFGRQVMRVTDVVVLGDALDQKVAAAAEHRTMLGHLVHQIRLMAQTGGRQIGSVQDLIDDPTPLIRDLVRASAQRTGATYDVGPAEEFRVVRYAGLEEVVVLLEQRAQHAESASTSRPTDNPSIQERP